VTSAHEAPVPSASFVWSPRRDLAVFGGSAALALGLGVALRPIGDGRLPDGLWLVFVLGLDVAHVWTTLFRTYLDREEVDRRRALYLGLPLVCYVAGVALHLVSHAWFWRVLAYVAVFHFIRQQVGWVAICRARAGGGGRLDRWLDDATIYLATGVPLVAWHARMPRAFHWFVEGDFVDAPTSRAFAAALLPLVTSVYALVGVGYVARAGWLARAGRSMWSKHLVVVTTALVWWVGIVAFDDDVTFTISNVTFHGLPYIALLWGYAEARGVERPASLVGRVARAGFLGFFAIALALAFAEELGWDRLVWHDREWLFGEGLVLDARARAFVVPLLALPQAVHYALDAFLWRRQDGGAAQARALGFRHA
jgi:hypothetical protein